MVRKKETKMKKTEEYKSDFSIYSKKILAHLKSDKFTKQLLEFFESIRIKDVFEVFQDLQRDDYYYSYEGISDYLRKAEIINVLDYYRKNLPKKYKYSEFSESSEMMTFKNNFEKMLEHIRSERNDNYIRISNFLEKFRDKQIGLDVESLELRFVLVGNSNDIPLLCDVDSNNSSKSEYTTQTIKILDLMNISSFANLNAGAIQKKFNFNLLRYISGIISGEEFASELASEIADNIVNEIASFSLSFDISNYVDLEKYPAVFYKDKELLDFVFKQKDFYDLLTNIYIDDQNNKKLKSACLNCLDINKIDTDNFYKLLNHFSCESDDSLIRIKGYSELSKKEQKEVLLSTFDDSDGINKNVPVKVLTSKFGNEIMFEIAKNKTKSQLLQILSGELKVKNKYDNKNIVVVKHNSKEYKINLISETPLYDFDIKLNKSQLSELKSEIVPILEELQDVLYYDIQHLEKSFGEFPDTKKKLFKYLTKNKSYVLLNLFKLFDWYPNRYNLSSEFDNICGYSDIKSTSQFLNRLSEKFCFDLDIYLYTKEDILDVSDRKKITRKKNLKLFEKDMGENFHLICPNSKIDFQCEYDKIVQGKKMNYESLSFSFSKEQ